MRIEEDCQDLPFEVVFDRKSKPLFFDLDEIPAEQIPEQQKKLAANPPFYHTVYSKVTSHMYPENRFRYTTRGIRRDVDQELLFVGGLQLDEAASRIVMRNP